MERLELLMRETAPDSSMPRSTMRRFSSDQGREYRYDPADSLGQGSALTQVFRGEDGEGRAVAVKQVRIRLDTSGRRRAEPRLAEREVEIARQLRDAQGPHLIPVLDYAHLDGELLLVMPLADYSLADRISDAGQLSSSEVRAMLLDVAQGMQELVAAGVLHRDIKPHNILWYRGHWCLADFGISRILDAATASHTWMGSGTAEYRAPELLDGKPETQLSDAYALGLSALEALTGSPVISGSDLRQAHASLVPVFPEGTDPLVRRAIAELLHKDPGGRPSDARRITELLQPAGTLSDAQRGLQSLRARQIERDLEHGALVAQAQEHSGLQRQARIAFTALWRRISDSATQAVLDATSTQDGDVFALAVGDAELRVHLSGAPTPAGPLLMVAELYIDRVGQSRIVGNLYCVGDSGVPQWRLVQFKNKGTVKSTGDRAEIFHAIWNSGDDMPPTLEAVSIEADAEAVLTLFASEAVGDSSNRPIRKGRIDRPVEFGYKAQVSDNDDGIVLDYAVECGAVPDGPQLVPAIKRIARRAGRAPRAVTADRGYGQASVERDLQELGVRTVAIPRRARPSPARKTIEHSRGFRRWSSGGPGAKAGSATSSAATAGTGPSWTAETAPPSGAGTGYSPTT